MEGRFFTCVNFVLAHETSYDKNGNPVCEHDPDDPGGSTMWGIDQRSHPNVNVCSLTEDQAKQIYHDGEWTKMSCEQLPLGFDLAVFDAAVNIGLGWTAKKLQELVGTTVDGHIGPKTIAAVNAAAAVSDELLKQFLDAREIYYRSLPTRLRLKFLKGWLARVADVRTAVAETPTQAA